MNFVTVRSVLNKKKSRDPWFLDEYTLNPYSGCSFNCLYCYIRGSKYGINMEEKLSIKENALIILEQQLALRSKKGQHGIIVLASATDPYLQIESETGLTRKMLELILKYRFPLHIITKSSLVTRDFDLLKKIEEQAIVPQDLKSRGCPGVFITFSFSTLDDTIAKIFEPGATRPSLRLKTLSTSVQEGFHSGVSLMPLLPFISDTEEALNGMFKAFKDAGAHYVLPATLTLFGSGAADSRTLVMRAVGNHFPDLLSRYKELLASGFQPPASYSDALKRQTSALSKLYDIPNSLI